MATENRSSISFAKSEIYKIMKQEIGDCTHQVAILDYPDYLNAGDMLIWRAQLQIVRDLGYRVAYVASRSTYRESDLRRLMPDGVVLLQGGGNFGDLWPDLQHFRERIFSSLHDYKVIQLPQSVHYENPENAASLTVSAQGHPDLTIMVRDAHSLEIAEQLAPKATFVYCPDSVLALSPRSIQRSTPKKPLALLRQDKEASGRYKSVRDALKTSKVWECYDWTLPKGSMLLWKLSRLPNRLTRIRLPDFTAGLVVKIIAIAFSLQEKLVLANAFRVIEGRPLVVTDRLHAHILATLQQVPNIVLENSYGKIGLVGLPYTGAAGSVWVAESVADINRIIANLNLDEVN